MDDSFTRSLYIGRDKALEVARRREAVEKELKARLEARIREHNDRIARAAHQKEQELKEKLRQRQERELQRQRAVLDRRCAQLEQDKVKKSEILQKAHNSASRSAQIQRKSLYAFGSSTPRAPTYLDAPRHYITKEFSASSERLGSPGTSAADGATSRVAVVLRTPSRILGGGPTATPKSRKVAHINSSSGNVSAAMTRSVFGRLNVPRKPSATTVSLSSGQGGRRTTSSNNSSNNDSGGESASSAVAGMRHATPSNMTQSMYNAKRETPLRDVKKTPAQTPRAKQTATNSAKPPLKKQTPNRNFTRPPPKAESVSALEKVENRPPPIRPRKATQVEKEKEVNDDEAKPEVLVNKSNAESLPSEEKNAENSDKEEKVLGHVNSDTLTIQNLTAQIEDASLHDNDSPKTQQIDVDLNQPPLSNDDDDNVTHGKMDENWEVEPKAESKNYDFEQNSSKNSSTGNLLAGNAKEEWDSGHESNCAIDVETTPTSLDDKIEIADQYSLTTPKALSIDENESEISKLAENNAASLPETTAIETPNLLSQLTEKSVPSSAADLEEKDRESRRQKLLEILQRTRNSANPPTPNNSTSSLGAGISMNSTDASAATLSTNFPLRNATSGGIDASALAQDLLAQRRQKLQGIGAVASPQTPATTTVASIMTKHSNNVDSNGNGIEQQILDLDSDLNGIGFYEGDDVIPSTTSSDFVQQKLNSAQKLAASVVNNNNGNGEHFRENSLIQMPGEVFSHVDMIRQYKQQVRETSPQFQQQQSDPEDPHNHDASKNENETRRENEDAKIEIDSSQSAAALTASN